MMKTKILILFVILFLMGCTDKDSNQTDLDNKDSPSCLVEDKVNKGTIICFEGELEYVKKKCSIQNKHVNSGKAFPIVTFSETEGCPRDGGYSGYCIMDGGEYIPYYYINSSLNISQKNKEIMKEIYRKDCSQFKGKWVSSQ